MSIERNLFSPSQIKNLGERCKLNNNIMLTKFSDGEWKVLSLQNSTIKTAELMGANKVEKKNAMELEHISHFQELVSTQYPEFSFEIKSRGENNHPDFVVKRGEDEIGMELTMLISGKIRKQIKSFYKIQQRLLDAYHNGRLRELGGIEIEIGFGDPFINIPDEKIDDSTLEELISSLESLASRPFEFYKKIDIINDAETPYPLSQIGVAGGGKINWMVTSIGTLPLGMSEFCQVTGFEVNHQISAGGNDFWINELNEKIKAKDVEKNSNNEILISVGMPDQEGFVTKIEEQGLVFLLERTKFEIHKPTYLKRIFLDCWGPQKVYILYDSN